MWGSLRDFCRNPEQTLPEVRQEQHDEMTQTQAKEDSLGLPHTPIPPSWRKLAHAKSWHLGYLMQAETEAGTMWQVDRASNYIYYLFGVRCEGRARRGQKGFIGSRRGAGLFRATPEHRLLHPWGKPASSLVTGQRLSVSFQRNVLSFLNLV